MTRRGIIRNPLAAVIRPGTKRIVKYIRLPPARPGVIRTVADEQDAADRQALKEYEADSGKFVSNVQFHTSFSPLTRNWKVELIILEEENR